MSVPATHADITMRPPKSWVAGSLPTRRRPGAAPPPAGARGGRAAKGGRVLIGRPLATAWRAAREPGTGLSGFGLAIRALLAVTLAAALFWFVFVQSWILAGAMVALLLLLAWLVRYAARDAPALPTGLSEADLHALDELLLAASRKMPDPAQAMLVVIKERLAKVLRALREGGSEEAEDAFFVQELVRRYLPDACRSYARWTGVAVGDQAAAERSLCSQLAKLIVRLDAILQRIDAGHAQEAANHEAFLDAKNRGSTK